MASPASNLVLRAYLTRPTSASASASASPTFRRSLASLSSPASSNDFTHVVIGGGVVGLAIGRHLAKHRPGSTLLLERHNAVGTETSSRNSEVIHNGAYYPPGSLKTRLCIRGRRLLYEYCEKHRVEFKKTGKWIVAQTSDQHAALEKLHNHGTSHGIPLRWLSTSETSRREPFIRCLAGAIESPETGILDSHSYMQSLLGSFTESGGDIALGCHVTRVEKLSGGGYKLRCLTGGEEVDITTDVVINSAGLGAVTVGNMILPESQHRKLYYAKGTYYVPLTKPPKVSTLIYPAPVAGAGGLGTHLTMDLGGNLRFGPDVEWVEREDDLVATEKNMMAAKEAIRSYFPSIGELRPDYCGMRPKLQPRGGVAGVDFWIRKEEDHEGWVNLLGIESPGLTSSLAIAEYVDELLYK
ncbi:FAD dependent oxidoreductase [Pyronema omphalodes]|nr:FAD dependent oxidoreductase [Pyronema omphalodes]